MPAKLVVTTKAEQMEEYPAEPIKIFNFHNGWLTEWNSTVARAKLPGITRQ
jgi:hypothetical protein